MATKDSGEIATNSNYTLGEYSFRIERSSVPGSSNDQITAVCRQGGKSARKSIQIPSSTQINGWYVEANETEARVYVNKHESISPDFDPSIEPPIPCSSAIYVGVNKQGAVGNTHIFGNGAVAVPYGSYPQARLYLNIASPVYRIGYTRAGDGGTSSTELVLGMNYTYRGKTVYYVHTSVINNYYPPASVSVGPVEGEINGPAAWTMVYGTPEDEDAAVLVATFAIDIKDAGGVGPGSDWNDPGDYDYDDYPDPDERDPDDPTYTLNLEVVGALSGRHNDPLNDTSYSYIPADKATVKDYGCGGDGGNGGGGGAGASNIVVYKFATSRADGKEIVCKAKRHGYGSGGGKGGKGGDGCILIYY